MASAPRQGSPDAGAWRDLSSSSGAHGLAHKRLNLACTGRESVIAIIQIARASLTHSTYDGKLRAFEDWCVKTEVIAFQSPIPVIQTRVWLSLLSKFGDTTVVQHPLVCHFIEGARRLRPGVKDGIYPWGLMHCRANLLSLCIR